MEIYLARTQGFCAGVASAVEIVEQALTKYGSPLYVFHEIVHNTFVVSDFKSRGVIFVDDLTDVPDNQRVIFSAHGVSPAVIEEAQRKNLKFIDATCPLVTKVHREAVLFSKRGYEIVLIGHKGHQELIGTSGYVAPHLLHVVEDEEDIGELNIDPAKTVGYLTQTTLSVTETKGLIQKLKTRFPNLIAPPREDICYATQNRQDAVKELAKVCDFIIICGSPNSSNSNRLRETGEEEGVASSIIDAAQELNMELLKGKNKVGISSGASVPRMIVDKLIERIQKYYPETIVNSLPDPEKNIVFPLPAI
ncbi:MAG TPA: 4-hydroxy-3-methylbut-2-enyl diphosphate reductase [Candidatus Omnitrophota bacterium]|nr:4-hydroxy-3-methylbut-2-enyl diphosphate reductase [Candidatus Omnitrophota bacterium]